MYVHVRKDELSSACFLSIKSNDWFLLISLFDIALKCLNARRRQGTGLFYSKISNMESKRVKYIFRKVLTVLTLRKMKRGVWRAVFSSHFIKAIITWIVL